MIPEDGGLSAPTPPVPSSGMSATRFCLIIGLVLGIVAAYGGLRQLLVVLVFGLFGLIIGRVLDGKLDLAALFGRSSSR
jgi:hypothetical protein